MGKMFNISEKESFTHRNPYLMEETHKLCEKLKKRILNTEGVKPLSDPGFIQIICETLGEPNTRLFTIVNQYISKEKMLEILIQTANVQVNGGIKVNDNTEEGRNKTPGGLFLHLLKSKVPEQVKEKIFKEERSLRKREKALSKEFDKFSL
mmetsp:Transcript_26958/g.23803  ORF Transcript_26958/g.23803 Transcript_26958/m.23803 type:complete len:151 (+) Transcript_26958:271-723(+)